MKFVKSTTIILMFAVLMLCGALAVAEESSPETTVKTAPDLTSKPPSSEDNPETTIKTAADLTSKPPSSEANLEERFQVFLDKMGWTNRVYEGGIIRIPERDIFVSTGTAFTKVNIGQPGWVESRLIAFSRAELEAKTKIVRFLGESTETKRSLELMENANWSDGSIQEAKRLGQVQETLDRIKKKTLALSESVLDAGMRKLDPEYDPETFDNKTLEERKTIVEDKFHQNIKSMALRTLIGVTCLYTTEGKLGNEYQVLVSVIWSPKLNRLAMSLMNDEYNIPPVAPGKALEQYLPSENTKILGTVGTRIVIDEKGHYAVLAYAQAQPRKASPARTQSALADAKQIAANRARGMVVNYIEEGLAMRDEGPTREISREFSDGTVGTEILREFQRRIRSREVGVTLRGVTVLRQWQLEHPETGQQVAGAVIAWSPSLASFSKNMDSVMKTKPAASKTTQGQNNPAENGKAAIESMKVNTSAY